MANITRQELSEIFQSAPLGADKKKIIERLKARGHTIEGLDTPEGEAKAIAESKVKETISPFFQKAGDAIDKGIKTRQEQPLFKKGVREIGSAFTNNKDVGTVERFKRLGSGGMKTLGGVLEKPVNILNKGISSGTETIRDFGESSLNPFNLIVDNLVPQGVKQDAQAATGQVLDSIDKALKKTGVSDATKGGVENVVEWYEGLSPDTKDLLKAMGITTEAVLSFQGAKKPAADLLKQTKNTLSTRNITKSVDSSFRAIKPSAGANRSITKIRSSIKRANEVLAQKGIKPSSLQEYGDAIKKTKQEIWDQVKKKIADEGKGVDVDLSPIADDIREMAQNKALLKANKSAADDLLVIADDLVEGGGKVDVIVAEEIKEMLNAELSGLFGKATFAQPIKNAKMHITKKIGEQLDEILSTKVKGEFAALKKDYGALAEIMPDINRRLIVLGKANPETLWTGLGKLGGVGNILKGAVTFDFGDVAKGVGQIAQSQLLKKSGDADELIKKAFSNLK